jgi:hypothetical protein
LDGQLDHPSPYERQISTRVTAPYLPLWRSDQRL